MAPNAFPIAVPTLGYVGRKEMIEFNHKVVLGAAGAIAASGSDAAADSGVTVVKTAAKVGRYTITVANGRRFKGFRGGSVSIIGPTDVIYGANTTGYGYFWRNDLMSSAGTIQLQFTQGGSNADAEVPDNFSFILDITVLVKP